MTLVCIRQPGFLPYVGFFKKIQSSDIFVYLDDTKYVSHGWDNRNKIKTDTGSMWMTVPINRSSMGKLMNVLIENNSEWKKKHLRSIQINYQNSPYFESYWDSIKTIYEKPWKKLIDLNLSLIDFFNSQLRIETECLRSSELNVINTGTERLVQICEKLNADIYLSGSSGHDYLDETLFQTKKIKVIFENFQHPVYKQKGKDFLPNMAIIDLLFNEGENSCKIISNTKNY